MTQMTQMTGQDIRQIAAFGGHGIPQDVPEEYESRPEAAKILRFVAENLGRLDGLITDFDDEAERVDRSKSFTKIGREQEMGRVALEFGRRVDTLRVDDQFLPAARQRLAIEQERVGESRGPGLSFADRVALNIAIRQCHEITPEAEIIGPYRSIAEQAIESGDDQTLEALLGVPASISPFEDEDRQELIDSWNAARSPVQARLVADLRRAISALESRLRVVRTRIASRTGTNDPLRQVASGGNA